MKSIRTRLALLNFLEFAVWGAYLISLGNYLGRIGMATQIGWFYAIQGIVSIFMPGIVGIIADRWIPAQKMLSICHCIAGIAMGGAAWYCSETANPEFAPLFAMYTLSVAFFMPTIGLANSVAYTALNKAGYDTIKTFPPIRVLGTVGFICSMLFVNFTQFQETYAQLFTSATLSILLCMYALTMPNCPVSKTGSTPSIVDALGLRAFALFKQKKMAIFFIFSMLLGVSLQITNSYGNIFITSFQEIAEFANSWGAKNANALISLSQVSETLFILLIPFCLKRFGIKTVMLMAMSAWVFRFGLFGLGNPGSGVWMFVLSMIVYGIAFDFFNISGSLYVDKQTDPSIRSSAQGLFMIMTNGIGATVGTLGAQAIVNKLVYSDSVLTPIQQIDGWHQSWLIFAGYALVVAVLFAIAFKDPKTKETVNSDEVYDMAGDPEGMVYSEETKA